MMHKQSWLLIVALMIVGCQPEVSTPVTTQKPVSTDNTSAAPNSAVPPAVTPPEGTTANGITSKEGTPPAPDNTAVNARDRDPNAKTPIDQNENETDIKITSDIRKQVVAEKTFSISAQNIKIITADGKVTLRGPVESQSEKEAIEKIAHDVAGQDKVDSQIEVTP